MTICPVASITRNADSAGMSRSTAAIRSRSIATSSRPSCPPPGSTTSPPRISRSNLIRPPGRRQRRLDEPLVAPATSSLEHAGALLERARPRREPERFWMLGEQLDGAREVGVGVGERAADRLLADDEVERRDRGLRVVHAEPERAAARLQERDGRGSRRVGSDRVDDERPRRRRRRPVRELVRDEPPRPRRSGPARGAPRSTR